MRSTKKRWMGALAVVATIGLISTGAFAATVQSGHPSGRGGPHGGMMGGQLATIAKDLNISTTTLQADLKAGQAIATVAQTQNVPTSTLISDLETAAQTKLTGLVTSGKITSTQEQQMLTRVDQQITNFVNGTMPKWNGPKGGKGFGGPHGGMMGGQFTTIAKDLNISTTTLQADLKAGQTIAAIAQTQNVPTSTLISDLETAAQTKLTGLVTSGKITSTQEQQMLTRVDQQITNFVNGTMPKRGPAGNANPQG